jgi:DNA-binding transcriptional regulator YhcF (GntR family)
MTRTGDLAPVGDQDLAQRLTPPDCAESRHGAARAGSAPDRRAGLRSRPAGEHDAVMSSTKDSISVDPRSPVPLHEQVAAAIRRAIADGEAAAGERLPPARDLAAVLGVNANTVLRALRALRDEGLVEFRRGRGVSVTGLGPQRSALIAKARELVALARRYGYRPEELTEIIHQASRGEVS